MLESVREYLPISGLEWDLVAQRHAAFHPDEERNGDQLKKKFNKLAKVKMGTGDPNVPPDVSEAKAIRKLIIEKTEGVTGSEEEPFALEEDYEEGDDGEEGEEDVQDVDGDPSVNEGAVREVGLAGVARAGGAGAARAAGNRAVQRSGGSLSSTSPHNGVSTILLLSYHFVFGLN
jgi:hypothetical protein